jgi:hypothetical protein
MPKKPDPQVAVRLPQATIDVLTAAETVRRLRGHQDLLAPVVEEFAKELAKDEAVQLVLQGIALNDRRSSTKIKPIRSDSTDTKAG